jgi:hypothetical protein
MNGAVVDDLVGEVAEYLSAGSVGLYEFIWILRTDHPEVPAGEQRRYASAALERLLQDADIRLVSQAWAESGTQQIVSGVQVSDEDWNDPTDKPYLAVIRADDLQ